MIIWVLAEGLPSKNAPLNGIFEWDQAKALKKIGHKIIYIAIDLRSIRRIRKLGLQVFERDGIVIFSANFPLGRTIPRVRNWISWMIYKRVCRKILKIYGIPNIAHAHFARYTGYAALKAKEKFGIDYIITEHDSWVNKDLISDYERKTCKNVYVEAKQRVAVSRKFQDRLQELYDMHFSYIPNMVDSSFFECVSKPHNGFAFISIGSLIDGKGMDKTIIGFAEVYKKYPNIKLNIIGTGNQKEELIRLAKDKGVDDAIVFMGQLPREEIKKYMETADCFVLMSKSETFGVAYIEALAAGLPVIATKCGGPESFVNEENGRLIEVDNINELEQAMEYMLTHKYDSERIKKYCYENFSAQTVAEKITSLLSSEEE